MFDLMKSSLLLAAAVILMFAADGQTTFTTQREILAIDREDQTESLRTKLLRKEVTLSDAISVLTTFKKVSERQYFIYAHQMGARGTVTLTGGRHFSWEIEPEYAARIRSKDGMVVYLLRTDAYLLDTDAKVEPSAPANGAAPRR
jgi:hypothetical protein